MAKKQIVTPETGMILVHSFFALLAVNAIIIYVANMYFPKQVVLGTFNISLPWAIFHSMTMLALVNTLGIPLAHHFENMRGRMLNSSEWMLMYFVVNAAGLWLISRFSEQFGLGVSSWLVVVALALVLDFVQGIVMMQLQRFQK